MLIGWDSKQTKQVLFAIMVEVITQHGWRPEGMKYVHARNREQAINTFFNANRFTGRRIHDCGNGVAQVVGYKIIDDEHKKLILSV